jgi:hypothetical protein
MEQTIPRTLLSYQRFLPRPDPLAVTLFHVAGYDPHDLLEFCSKLVYARPV